jgi:hypothetical protein
MTELEKVDIPRPRADMLEAAFTDFAKKHPWVPKDGLKPKSVARDMWERGATFGEYVKEYGLVRSEGALLRYLSDAYKALVQSVPEGTKTDEVHDLAEWLRAVVKQVDSSLLDEWESLRDPAAVIERAKSDEPPPAPDVTTDRRAFTVLVRNAMFRLLRALAQRSFTEASTLVVAPDGDPAWTPERLEAALVEYEIDHGRLRVDPASRAPRHTRIDTDRDVWRVEQAILDEEDANDWMIDARIDLARAREEGAPVIELLGIVRA